MRRLFLSFLHFFESKAFASQSDLVLTDMKTMMNRKNSIKETESVYNRGKLRDGLKGKQGVQVAETWLRHKGTSNTFSGLFKANRCFNVRPDLLRDCLITNTHCKRNVPQANAESNASFSNKLDIFCTSVENRKSSMFDIMHHYCFKSVCGTEINSRSCRMHVDNEELFLDRNLL